MAGVKSLFVLEGFHRVLCVCCGCGEALGQHKCAGQVVCVLVRAINTTQHSAVWTLSTAPLRDVLL